VLEHFLGLGAQKSLALFCAANKTPAWVAMVIPTAFSETIRPNAWQE
jgi:hypothetical protein